MEQLLLLVVCMLIGVSLQFVKDFPKNAHQSLNLFVIYVSLPAIALYHIPKIEISYDLLFPIGVPWIGFGLSFLFFKSVGSFFSWPRKLIGALIITAGLGNTSFVGFPVVEALYGKEGLQTAILVDQPGSFVVMATFGIAVASSYATGKVNYLQITRKIVGFPPFIAFLIACFLAIFQVDFPDELQVIWKRLGSTVTPIALIAVGLQLSLNFRSKHFPFLGLGLLFKLILTPLFFLLFYKFVVGAEGLHIEVSIIEAAMPPMITGSIIAIQYGLKPKLSAMMIGYGIPISGLSLWLWYELLQFLG